MVARICTGKSGYALMVAQLRKAQGEPTTPNVVAAVAQPQDFKRGNRPDKGREHLIYGAVRVFCSSLAI